LTGLLLRWKERRVVTVVITEKYWVGMVDYEGCGYAVVSMVVDKRRVHSKHSQVPTSCKFHILTVIARKAK
jgi:hypothetical protein